MNLDNPINTDTYEYASNGWRDRLVSYNGSACGAYDALGNPSTYRGATAVWSHGRQLDSLTCADGAISFGYNANGVRVSKNANGRVTKFYLDGTTILAQECGNDMLVFTRGIDGLNGFNLNGTEYFYKKNVQGDVIAIMDESGNEIVHYVYDAWGNHVVQVLENGSYTTNPTTEPSQAYMSIAECNPFRYRSYYYDVETGLYYLNTRYYDPEVGRFINADDISEANPKQFNGLNLYSYCLNNPVRNQDPMGTSTSSAWGSWFSNLWNKITSAFKMAWNWGTNKALPTVKNWFNNTFGGALYVTDTVTKRIFDYFFFGMEKTTGVSKTISGASKIFTFFVEAPSEEEEFWNYRVGFSLNIGKFNLSTSMGILDIETTIGYDEQSFYLMGGARKIGIGLSNQSGDVQDSTYFFIRTIPVVFTVVAIKYMWPVLGAIAVAIASGVLNGV